MKISFIIPVLNGEKYIKQCLDHIGIEMDSVDEIIVVDNGSTDGTLDIVRRYEDVNILIHPGITIGALRNRGAEKASGALFAFIDSDCILCKGWRKAVEKKVQDLTIHATGSIYDIPENANWIERAWWSFGRSDDRDTDFIISGNFIIRRKTFVEISGFDESMVTDEDTDISHRLMTRKKRMVESPKIRVIHLGNAKSLGEFYNKEKWHSAGIIDAFRTHGLDKPLVLTFVFIVCILSFLASIPLTIFYDQKFLALAVLILLVPLIATLHRIIYFGNYKYLFHLIVLFSILYFARTVVLVEFALHQLRYRLAGS